MQLMILFLKLFTVLPLVFGAPIAFKDAGSEHSMDSRNFRQNDNLAERGKERREEPAEGVEVKPMIFRYDDDLVERGKEQVDGPTKRVDIDSMVFRYKEDVAE